MRLIDADALYKKFLHLYETDKKATGANAYDLCAMLTEDAPTIDAVPVVRCKDCVAVSVCNDKLVCSRISDVIDGYYHGTVEVVKPDDYCSKGIRRSCAKMDGGVENA